MKKININKIKTELNSYEIEETTKELMINNIMLYNDLLKRYNDGETKISYLLYQLNMQIFKQMLELKRDKDKVDSGKNDDSQFGKFIKDFKNDLEKRG